MRRLDVSVNLIHCEGARAIFRGLTCNASITELVLEKQVQRKSGGVSLYNDAYQALLVRMMSDALKRREELTSEARVLGFLTPPEAEARLAAAPGAHVLYLHQAMPWRLCLCRAAGGAVAHEQIHATASGYSCQRSVVPGSIDDRGARGDVPSLFDHCAWRIAASGELDAALLAVCGPDIGARYRTVKDLTRFWQLSYLPERDDFRVRGSSYATLAQLLQYRGVDAPSAPL